MYSRSRALIASIQFVQLLTLCVSGVHARQLASLCKPIPGDENWPKDEKWQQLNSTLQGRLIATNPIAHVCHDPTFSAEACKALKEQWGAPELKVDKPAEILAPWFQNQSCTPFTSQNTSCTLGNHASYSINVSSANDIIAGVNFAREQRLRLVIRNTGHDLLGKSTGKGALALWTYNLKTMELLPAGRRGMSAAIKLGAGVQGGEASRFVQQHGFRLVIGSCPTVGLAGGFAQGGGHSSLSGLYGLAADNILEWEVVTADGKLLIATPSRNKDLYWALSGGGGGNYGVVVSMTVRVFPETPVTSASFQISMSSAGSKDKYWEAVAVFHKHLLQVVDNEGLTLSYAISREILLLYALVAPNRTTDQVDNILEPMLSELRTLGISLADISFNTSVYGSFNDMYLTVFAPVASVTPMSPVAGGRMVSRSNVETDTPRLMNGLRAATESGNFTLTCVSLNVNKTRIVMPVADNSVNPKWRETLATCIIGSVWTWNSPWGVVQEQQKQMIEAILPALEYATPGSGVYLNEANFGQSNWVHDFYGINYRRLRSIKEFYDPSNVFYAVTAVGSQNWKEDKDGRLCQTKNGKGQFTRHMY